MNKPEIHIEIVSDVVCPWCYIGKRRIERAMDQLKDQIDFHVTYTPFELNPDIPPAGRDQQAYLTQKFGGKDRYEQITHQVTKTAGEEGLKFDFANQKVSPNTRNAHRIIWFAKSVGLQGAVKEAFLKAYFEDGVDLTRPENLVRIAVQAGINEERVIQLLNSDEGLAEVEALERLSQQRGINGVPFYVINNQYGVSGAQPTPFFVEAFTSLLTEKA